VRLLRRGLAGRGRVAQPSVDWLVVGLGNPGPRYAATRHNLGREALLRFAALHGAVLDQLKERARYGRLEVADQRVCAATPTTYMNESGRAVAPLARFFKIRPERVLLVVDDLDLPLGTLRVRPHGGAGGHNGVASVLEALATQAVPRVRLGIGRPPPDWDPADYVLARFAPDECAAAEELAEMGAQAVEAVLRDGLDKAMNALN